MPALTIPFLTVLLIIIVALIGIVALIKSFYVKVPQGTALIINGLTDIKVYFTGGLVLPVINKKEYMQISLIRLEIDRRGKEGLICNQDVAGSIPIASSNNFKGLHRKDVTPLTFCSKFAPMLIAKVNI